QKINLNKYREILSVADIETKINAKKVQKELNEYLDKAKTELPYQTYKALTEGDVIANIASISSPLAGEDARRAGEGSPLSLSNYKELSKYIALYEYENSSDPLSLYKEERNLFAELLIKSADNKEIETVILSLAFSKFKRVMENKATDAEFKYIKDFKVENINKLWDRTVNTETFKKMLPYFYAYNEYYLANETRNEEFADRIIKGINKEKPVTAVITGGFHTEELKQILLSKGLSVSVLTPKITGGIKAAQEKYIRLFIEQEAEEEAFFEAKIAGGAVEARTLAQYLRTGDETELFKILNDINVLHEQKVFGAITKEEILKAIIDTYNETYPSEKVSSEDGRIKNIAAGLKKNGYGLKPASVFDALFKNKNSRFYKAYTILAAPLAETFLIFGLAALINPLAAGAVFVASHILADIAFSKDKKETLAKIKSHLNWRFLLVSAALTVPFAAAMLNPAAVFALSFGMHGIYNYAVLKFKLQDKKFPLADAFDDIFDDDELESRIMVISLDSKASPGLLKHMLSIAKIDFDMNKGHFLFAEVVNRNVMGQVEIPGLEKRFIENDIRIPELSARIRQSKDKTALIAAEVKYGKIQRVFLKNDSGKYKLVKGLPWEFLPEYKAANGKVIFAVDDSKTPEMPAAEQKQGGIKEVYNGKLGKEAARRREYVNITVTNENTKEEKEYSVPLEGIANAEAPKDLNLNEGRHTIRGIPADNINASAGIFGFKREGLSSSLKKFAGENAVTAIETQDGEIIKVFAMNKSGEYEQIWSVFDGVTILDLRAGKEISFSEWEKMTPEERGKGRYGIDGILNGNKKGKIRFPGVEETEIPELKKFTEKGEAIISVEAQGGKVIKVSVMNEDEEKYEQIWISEAYSSSLQNGAEYKAPSKPEKKEEASGKSKNNNPAESVASAPLPSRKKQSPAVKKQSKTDTTTDGRLKPADSKAGKFDITAANADTKEEKTYSVFGVVVVADVVKNLNLSEGRHIIGGIPVGKKNASKSIFGFEREGLSSKLKEFAGEDSITITALETYDGEIIKVWALDRNEENPKYEQVWSVFDEATITNSSAKRKISLSDWENMMPQERGKRYYKIDEILNGNKKGKIIFPKVEETEIPELKEFTANGEVMISIKLRGGKIIEVSVREKHKESYRQIWAAETAAVFSSSLENGTEYESSESPKPPVNLIKKQEQERVSDSVSPETDVKKDKPFEKTPEPESENKETAPEKPKYSLIEQLLAKAMAKDGKPDNKIQPAANLDLAADKSEVKIERLEDKKDSDNIITAATKPAAAGHKKLSNKAVKTSAKIKKVGRRRYDKQSDVTISRRYDKESGVTITDLLDPDKGIISYSKMREIISEWKTMKPQERKGRYEVKGISSNNQRGVIKFLGMEQSVPKSKRAILLAEKTVSIVIEPGATEKVFGEIKEIYTENETGSGIYNVRLYPERYIEITNLAAKSKGEKEHTRMYPAWGRGTDAPKDLWDLTTGHYLIKGAFAEKEGLIRFLNFRQQIFKLGKYMEDEAITSAEIAFEAQDGEIIEVWVWNENTQDYELIKPGVGGMTITDLETGKELFYPELQKIISGWKTMKPQERKGHYEVKGIAKKQNIKFLGMHKTIPEAKLGNLSEGKTIAIVVEPGATEKVFGEIKEIYEEEIAGSGEYNVRLYPEKYIEITDLAAKERGEKEHTRMYPAWSVGTHIPKNLPNMATGEYLIRGRFNKSTYGTVTFPGISKRREISKLGELVEKAMEESKDGVMLAIETQDGEMIKVSLDDEDAKYIPLLIAGGQNGNSDFSDIFSLNSETFIVDEKTGDITVLADRKKMTNREREYLAVKAKEGVKIKVVIAMPTENEVSILGKMYPVSAIKKLLKNPEESIAVVIQNGEIKEVFTKDASGQYVIPHAAIFSKFGLKSVNPIVQFISNPFTSPVWETAYLAVLSLINPVAGYLAFFASHIIADTLILKEGETRVEALKKTLKAHSDWRFLFGSFFIALPFMVLPFVTFGIFPIAIAMMFSFIIHEGYNALAVKYGFTPASVLSILETKEETIEDIIDSYIRTVPEVKPELLAEFARRNALSPEKLQVVFNEHGNEEWFQDIFYGMLEANELERIDYVTSKVGVGISKNLVNFVLAIRGNFDEFKETIVKKYKDEPWFRDILSGGYYIHRLNAKGIENIDEILKKLRIKNSQGLISCANEINTDLLDERK
ncbi:MAG: hypothetical protein FWC88_02115, partial [Endomicrobia bacterium]|nr:hypothetical protein [Endomicrobiia bacterium]